MSKKVLITGSSGFLGSHLCEYLSHQDVNIIGFDVCEPKHDYTSKLYLIQKTHMHKIGDILKSEKPDYIIHLAGTFGTNDNQEVFQMNVMSMTEILEGIRENCPDSVFLASGSAAEYGLVPESNVPIMESENCEPVSVYGLSKLLATQTALYYHRMFDISVTIFRPFQLIGKGISTRLAPGAFAKQLKNVISNNETVIKVGNLESFRDFLDVKDAIRAIWGLCMFPAPGEIFNLCSGVPTKMADLLQVMIDFTGKNVIVEVDPQRLRDRQDVSTIYGSNAKLRDHIEWNPTTVISESINSIFL